MMTIKLYEDNAGGLTITHGTAIYTGIEHLDDGYTGLCAIVLGELDGDMDPDPDGEVTEHDELIADYTNGRVTVHGLPGVAGCRCLGIDS